MSAPERMGGSALVTCPLCLRERERRQTLITHACTDRGECFRYVRGQRDKAQADLGKAQDGLHALARQLGWRL